MFNADFTKIHGPTIQAARKIDASRPNSSNEIKVEKVFTEAKELERTLRRSEIEARDLAPLRSEYFVTGWLIKIGMPFLPHRYFYETPSKSKIEKTCNDLDKILRSNPTGVSQDDEASVNLEAIRLRKALSRDGVKINFLSKDPNHLSVTFKNGETILKYAPRHFGNDGLNSDAVIALALKEALRDEELAVLGGSIGVIGLTAYAALQIT